MIVILNSVIVTIFLEAIKCSTTHLNFSLVRLSEINVVFILHHTEESHHFFLVNRSTPIFINDVEVVFHDIIHNLGFFFSIEVEVKELAKLLVVQFSVPIFIKMVPDFANVSL